MSVSGGRRIITCGNRSAATGNMFFLPGHEPYLTRNAPLLAREEPLFTGIAFLPGGNELLSEGIVSRLGGIGRLSGEMIYSLPVNRSFPPGNMKFRYRKEPFLNGNFPFLTRNYLFPNSNYPSPGRNGSFLKSNEPLLTGNGIFYPAGNLFWQEIDHCLWEIEFFPQEINLKQKTRN